MKITQLQYLDLMELVGQNLWNKDDTEGKMLVQELFPRGTDKDGGFIRYIDPFKEGDPDSTSK